jgi:predicted alpha-1,6-mannanase (GH76 family)
MQATASNLGPVITAVELYGLTKNSTYLQWAETVYSYWWKTMLSPSGQIADHVLPTGQQLWWSFTYNQGVGIGASLALYHAVGTPSFLANAQLAAAFLLANETVDGVLFDGSSCVDATCAQFKGIGFRYLVQLCSADVVSRDVAASCSAALNASATAIWSDARDAASTLFAASWTGPPPSSAAAVNVGQETSALMAVLLYANWIGG